MAHKTIGTKPGQPPKHIKLNEQEELDLLEFELLMQEKRDKYAWLQNRRREYPSIEDQLDIIYHQGLEDWKAVIKAIKDKYPKPASN